jgi:hypothetical protein
MKKKIKNIDWKKLKQKTNPINNNTVKSHLFKFIGNN